MICKVFKYSSNIIFYFFDNMKEANYILTKVNKYNKKNLKIVFYLHKNKKLYCNYEIKNKRNIIQKGELNYFKTKNRLEQLGYNV